MARVRFIEQRSDREEHCSRCDQLHREVVISAGEKHWALIEDATDLDAPPRVILCEPCRGFIRQAPMEEKFHARRRQ